MGNAQSGPSAVNNGTVAAEEAARELLQVGRRMFRKTLVIWHAHVIMP